MTDFNIHDALEDNESCPEMGCEWCRGRRIDRLRAEAVEALMARAVYFAEHPELVPYVSTSVCSPGWPVFDEPDHVEIPLLTDRLAERALREFTTRIEMLHAAGWETRIVNIAGGGQMVAASHPEVGFEVHCYTPGVPTAVVEEVAGGV